MSADPVLAGEAVFETPLNRPSRARPPPERRRVSRRAVPEGGPRFGDLARKTEFRNGLSSSTLAIFDGGFLDSNLMTRGILD